MRKLTFLIFISWGVSFAQPTRMLLTTSEIYNKIDLTGVTNLIGVGDSFMYGLNSTPTGGAASDYTNSFINLFRVGNSFSSIQNVGIGGTGTLTMINQVKSLSYTSSSSLMVVNVGLNDIRRGGNGSKTLKQLEAGYLYYLQKHISINRIFSGSSSVTRTGTFANADFTPSGAVGTNGSLPGTTLTSYSNTLNSTWEYTFTGTKIGFVFFGTDGVTATGYGRLEVYIDNVSVDVVECEGVWYSGIAEPSPLTTTNTLGAVPYMIHGLSNASHTIKIRVVDSGEYIALDYFFQPDLPANVGPIIFCEIPYLTSSGYAMYGGFTPPHNNATQAKSDDASNVIFNIVNQYRALGYRISFARTNAFFDCNNDIDLSDSVHPTNAGHVHIQQALQNLIK